MLKLLTSLLVLTTVSVRADVVNITASERGYVFSPAGAVGDTNNGASPGNSYFAGFISTTTNGKFRDWFEFSIPTLTGGALASATLELDQPASNASIGAIDGHAGGSLTFAVYGLSARPLLFSDVTTSNPFGSVGTSSASDGTTVDVTLNAAALAAIGASQGGNIFIGGIDSGELVSTSAYDFGGTENRRGINVQLTYNSVLQLQTAPSAVPEPNLVGLLTAMLVGIGGIGWRKRRA